jgi:hypothetical protein
VAIALAILMTVVVSVSSLLATSFKVGANSRYKQEATEIASSTLDDQLANGAVTLLGETGDTALPSVTSSGQTYLLEMEVEPYDPGNLACVSPASDPGAMLKVSVWATWTNQASGSKWWISGSSTSTGLLVEETSLLAVPAAAIDPTLGSLLVTIQGVTNNSIAGVSVTATPSSGSPETVTTTAGGCALFANIAVTPTWTLSFGSVSGDRTEQELTSIPTTQPISIAADTTTTVSYSTANSPGNAYDVAATVNPVYVVPLVNGAQPMLPSNINSLPLSFYSANLQTSPYVTTSPASVFPMPTAPSYYVVAGSCGAESAPRGYALDGQPVTVTAGSTVTPTVNLVPLKIFVQQGSSLVSGPSVTSVTAQVSNAAGTGADSNCPSTGSTVMPTLTLATSSTTWTSFIRGKHHRQQAHFVTACSFNCSTSTALAQPTAATYGSPVTFTATVTCTAGGGGCSPVNSGTVTFKNGSTVLGTGAVNSSGVATFVDSALPVGGTAVTATYGASGKWSSSAASASETETITAAGTTTTVVSNPNPNAYGTSDILTATVTAASPSTATPTGTVTFKNNGVNITTPSSCVNVALNGSGVATCTVSGLSGGSYPLTAAYAPSPANFTASTSLTVTQSVTASSTTTAVTSSSSPNSASGSSVTFTATVTAASGGPAVGSVAFKDGATTLGTVAVNGSGVATYATSSLAVGSHTISAVFTATNPSNFSTSTGTLVQGVNAGSLLIGLPYGVWLLSATYINGGHTYLSSNEAVQVVVTVTAAGFSVNGGAVQAAGQPVVVSVA